MREGIAKQGSLIVILSNSNVIVSPAKMADDGDAIWGQTHVGRRNRLLDCGAR